MSEVWAAAVGAVIAGGVSAAYANNGRKAPGTADYTPVDPQEEQRKAIAGNLANQDDIEQLLTRANKYTQGQASDMMEMAVPGYGKLSAALTDQAMKRAQNPYDVPPEVEANLTRIASERGVSRGTRGQTNQFSLLRDLGVNQLQYGQQNLRDSLGALQTISGVAPKVSAASPLSFYLTPQQAISATTNNNQNQQAIAQGGLNAGAAAANYNNDSLWSGIMKGAGMLATADWSGGKGGAGGSSGGGAGAGGPG